jgi:hypothetical protein
MWVFTLCAQGKGWLLNFHFASRAPLWNGVCNCTGGHIMDCARGTQGYLDWLALDLEMLSKPLQDDNCPQEAWQMSGRNRTLIEVDSMAAASL